MRLNDAKKFSLLSTLRVMAAMLAFLMAAHVGFAQETTGGLRGTVKDPSGAVVAKAKITVRGASLTGTKTATTDGSGYYHFSNLPAGAYQITVEADGFSSLKRGDVIIEVGHLPSIDFSVAVGASSSVVEVTSAPLPIDVTTTATLTNITQDVLQYVPHGTSFQSVIQFAPASRNEPLAGQTPVATSNGNGGSPPGSTSNGQINGGFSIAGGADSENSYLVEGQETANIIGGYSHTNVPFDFIQEVQVKTSGVEAGHGGSLGGVINVIMRKGTNQYHGSLFLQFQNSALQGSPTAYSRYDPSGTGARATNHAFIDPAYQQYQPIKDKTSDILPGFTVGGPIVKDKVFFFAGFNPEWNNLERRVNFGGTTGSLPFSRNQQTYYTTGRIDASITPKLRVFGSLLYQGQREAGENLPRADSTNGLLNVVSTLSLAVLSHSLGYAAPNLTLNTGADWTISQNVVATTRFGYFFENYHDLGFPTTGNLFQWYGSGVGATSVNGSTFPTDLVQLSGYSNVASNQNYTVRNTDKNIQLDQDVAIFKSGWGGAHNFKFGYQLHRQSNDISQRWNVPDIEVLPGSKQLYAAAGTTGVANCAVLVATYGKMAVPPATYGNPKGSNCTGTYGYIVIQDIGSLGKATSYNHSIFGEDAWTIGKGLTLNYGLRVENEYLPSETTANGFPSRPISFGWNDKVAPRAGFAWDVTRDGKTKVFGNYGVFNDTMKLNLAIGAFGGQYWQNCAYALMTGDLSAINVTPDASGRYCTGDSTGHASFGGSTPSGLIFLENVNNRGTEGVTQGLHPYRQHETAFGVDRQLASDLTFHVRWDRRRLDHVIEDAALFDSTGSEVFTIVNPGEGQNATNSTCDGTIPLPTGTPLCPPNIKAARSYDSVEFRLDKTLSNHWFGTASYTYSRLRGNYAGLTDTDLADGGGGRNAPNFSRAFDETYFQFNANGGSSSGPLATDRPNAFKGYAYYDLKWWRHMATDFGIFQVAYSGSPVSSYLDVGYSLAGGGSGGLYPVYVLGRGNWIDVSQNASSGLVSFGTPYARRTPWFVQTDFNLKHTVNLTERYALSFDATVSNLLNQRLITAYNSQIDTSATPAFISPGGVPYYRGGVAYSAYEHPYDWKTLMNTNAVGVSSQYGKPFMYQVARAIRLQLHFTF